MHDCLQQIFPQFMAAFGDRIQDVKPSLTAAEIHAIESGLGVALPESFKTFLLCTEGFWLERPWLNFLWPRFFDSMPDKLFFAEYFIEADGDQVFFDVSKGSQSGEYPVYYYSHEDRPPKTWKLADSFVQWLEGLC